MPWLPRLAAGATVALTVGGALLLAEALLHRDRAAVTSTSPADGATLARAPTEVGQAFTGPVDPKRSHVVVSDGSGPAPGQPAPVSGHRRDIDPAAGHQHDIDPVSAGLLVADGITVLAVVGLLLRRPRRSASGRR